MAGDLSYNATSFPTDPRLSATTMSEAATAHPDAHQGGPAGNRPFAEADDEQILQILANVSICGVEGTSAVARRTAEIR